MLDVTQYGFDNVQIEESRVVFQGFFRINKIRLRHRLFAGGVSQPIERELFCRGAASGVLLYDPQNQLIGLVEQFRIGALNEQSGPWLFEVIAGMIDENTNAEHTAHKEINEEAGITDVQLYPICDYLVSPGGSDEKMFLYCGITNLVEAEGLFGREDEHEDIRFHVFHEQKVFAALQEGCFNNAATTIALLWLQLHKAEFQL